MEYYEEEITQLVESMCQEVLTPLYEKLEQLLIK